jgi:nucleoside-diphosphate-sugar epimerase
MRPATGGQGQKETAMSKRIMFTGGSGKAGRHVVQYLVGQGYKVLNLDTKPLDNPKVRTLITDITDSGQVYAALSSYMGLHEFDPSLRPQKVDAVVHFAAIPRIMITPDNELFRVNALGTYNVIEAAVTLGIRKIIIASSETTYGLVFSHEPRDPAYFPLDEEYDVDPMDSYALSKVVNEKTARSFALRSGADIYALRIGNVIEPHEYDLFPKWFADPPFRKRIAWSYIDARDLGQITRLAVEKDGLGFQIFNAANDDTSSDLPTQELLQRYYPKVPVKRELGEFETLLSNRKAREMLGFRPEHSWRGEVKG